jgi:hypothetical protein
MFKNRLYNIRRVLGQEYYPVSLIYLSLKIQKSSSFEFNILFSFLHFIYIDLRGQRIQNLGQRIQNLGNAFKT